MDGLTLVTGASGNVGAELVRALLAAGEPVRALIRSAGSSLPEGVEGVVGDLNQPHSLTDALSGVRGLFRLSGYADMRGLLAEAVRAGAERVVLLSGGGAVASDQDNAVSRYQLESELAVHESGVPWTILRPCEFMSNASRCLPGMNL